MNNNFNFTDRLLSLNDKLQECGYTVTELIIGKPANRKTFDIIERSLNLTLPDDIKQFYRFHNGITLGWNNPSDNTISGWIDIWSIERMFGGYYGNEDAPFLEDGMYELLWFDNHDNQELEFRKSLRIIEPHLGTTAATAIRFEAEYNYKLYYTDIDLLIGLPLSFNEYMEILIITSGLNGIRYDLQNDEFYNNPESANNELNQLPIEVFKAGNLSFLNEKHTSPVIFE